ncbi:MAG: glutamine--fructose-6-phosphate transaminase (isomerizing), partial [Oscillospiraceae bacterium]
LSQFGVEFKSETDTEVLAQLLNYNYNGNPIETIQKTLSMVSGSYALGIIFKDLPGRIYAVRKDSPLIVGLGEDENFIASDVPAILEYTKEYYLLEENEIAILEADNVKICSLYGEEIKKEKQIANWDVEAAEKGGYPHYMLKEINEQPETIKKTIDPRIKDGLPCFDEEGLTEDILKGVKRIHIVACGTAMHAGVVGRYVIEKLARVPVNVDIASEFRYRDPIIEKDDLMIVISQSGETADTLAALRLAKEVGLKTIAIVNAVGSSIAREADITLYTWGGLEIAVASTKAYSVQIAMMYMLAFKLALVRGKITEDECRKLVSDLREIPDMIGEMLKSQEKYQFTASQLINATSIFYIGRGLDYALSMEGSLKLKEISYIHSESYAAGELKHGTISLIEDGIPVIAVATQTDLYEKTVSNIKEVKARGAMVVMICRKDAHLANEVSDYLIEVPDVDNILMPLLTVIPLQLLAYYTSILRGCDVDKPRNLAKSVTVE